MARTVRLLGFNYLLRRHVFLLLCFAGGHVACRHLQRGNGCSGCVCFKWCQTLVVEHLQAEE